MQKANKTKQILSEILNIELLNDYIQQLYEFTNVPVTILDAGGEIIAASEWIDLCKVYMHTNDIRKEACIQTCAAVDSFNETLFTCPNGLCMYGIPIKIEKYTVAYLVLSQFFMNEPNETKFFQQLRRKKVEEEALLKLLEKVPVLTEQKLQRLTAFLYNFVLLLQDMIERRVKARELEEEVAQGYEELEASYQDVSSLNEQLNVLNAELIMKNSLISTKERRYRILIEKMSQGTIVLRKNKIGKNKANAYDILEINQAMEGMSGKKELLSFVLNKVNSCLGEKTKHKFRIKNKYYEIDCTALNESEVLVCVTDTTEIYEKLNYKQKQMWNLVTAMSKLVEKRDLYTADHQKKVAILATRIAIEMKLDEQQIESVYIASMLHDIGKISIPAELLTKPDQLSPIEYELMKTHVINAYDILAGIHFTLPITEIVMQHHERLDGSGYPEGLDGAQTCIEAKIVAVADVYEAITSHRPYRPSLGHDFAKAHLLEGAGILYDSDIVQVCCHVASETPWEKEDIERYLWYGPNYSKEEREFMLWKDKYEVGIQEIDEQHKELFCRVEAFIKALRIQESWEIKIQQVSETLAFMKVYIVEHFNTEELYQIKIGYPGFEEHKRKHSEMLHYITEISDEYERKEFSEALIQQFAGKLLSWLIQHVALEDQKIADYAKSTKQSTKQ